MESAKPTEMNVGTVKILAAGSVEGHRVELLEFPDGKFVISRDGMQEVIYQVGACNLESCTKSFLAFMQSSREAVSQVAMSLEEASDCAVEVIGE